MFASLKRTIHRRAVRSTLKRVKLVSLSDHLRSLHTQCDSDVSDEVPVHGVGQEPVADNVNEVDCGAGDGLFGSNSDLCGDVLGGGGSDCEIITDGSLNDSGSRVETDGEDVIGSDANSDCPPIDGAEKEQYVIDTVREWAQLPGVLSMSKLDDLLHRLSVVFPRMPLTYTTLFQCDYNFDIEELPSGGTLWYKGIRANLKALNLNAYVKKFNKIVVDIGIDGLPLDKIKLWPILGHLVGTDNHPFIIAVYRGAHDPVNNDEFLEKLVAELKCLFQDGFTMGDTTCPFVVRFYVLDAVARSSIKNIIGHGGYCACERCEVEGVWYDRMTFLDLDQPLRSDESFQQRRQPRHHRGVSPLEAVGTGMVSQFPLDPMHLVYAGAFKHFNRKPCSLKYFKKSKCTQLRRMLLYDGIVVFKGLIDENIYDHFLLLHCGIYILSSKSLYAVKSNLAKEFLRMFVSHSARVYGPEFVVYNVHSLIHLAEECDSGCTLDEMSAFKFENRLKSVKETLRSGLHQLQQLARRDVEKSSNLVKLDSRATHIVLSLKQQRRFTGLPGSHYKKLKAGSLMLRVGKADGCFSAVNGDIVVLYDIELRQKKVFLIGRKFRCLEDFYAYPIPSSDIGIFKVSDLGKRRLTYRLKDVNNKCYLMPHGTHFVCVPILHTFESLRDLE
ncbi:hypothetical protein ONE63_008123 [Megalurothrips usitatus]|uniref:Transposase domain-containing protein n=1 Tax=Megalurothrips usitatus TaxID=439358 RepID=A0AAV7XLJ8_9NEOP|nr:hypothetical protein ONE63_008123 [Megalurothrips usitatus]